MHIEDDGEDADHMGSEGPDTDRYSEQQRMDKDGVDVARRDVVATLFDKLNHRCINIFTPVVREPVPFSNRALMHRGGVVSSLVAHVRRSLYIGLTFWFDCDGQHRFGGKGNIGRSRVKFAQYLVNDLVQQGKATDTSTVTAPKCQALIDQLHGKGPPQ